MIFWTRSPGVCASLRHPATIADPLGVERHEPKDMPQTCAEEDPEKHAHSRIYCGCKAFLATISQANPPERK